MPKNNLLKSGVILSVCLLTALFAPEVYGNQLLLFNFLIFITLTQGVNIIYGFTGYLPFGYSGFFGLVAYGFAVSVMHISLNIPLAILIGVLASIVVSIILIPLLRLSGPYFAIANMTVALALMEIVSNPALEGLTRGPYGV